MSKKDKIGVIHGRFQPLHNGHMKDLVLPAAEQCEHLIVGIANPDPLLTAPHPANPVRAQSDSNPFTFYERATMIRSTLVAIGMKEGQLTIVPFPINRPELLKHYVPFDATFYVTVYDDWTRYKKELLESLGLKVVVIFDCQRDQQDFSATLVRKRMASGGDWKSLVPEAVATFVCENHLEERLKRIRDISEQGYQSGELS